MLKDERRGLLRHRLHPQRGGASALRVRARRRGHGHARPDLVRRRPFARREGTTSKYNRRRQRRGGNLRLHPTGRIKMHSNSCLRLCILYFGNHGYKYFGTFSMAPASLDAVFGTSCHGKKHQHTPAGHPIYLLLPPASRQFCAVHLLFHDDYLSPTIRWTFRCGWRDLSLAREWWTWTCRSTTQTGKNGAVLLQRNDAQTSAHYRRTGIRW